MKSIKLNTIFFICLFIFILATSLTYLLVFTNNLNRLERYTLKHEAKNLGEVIDSVFVTDITTQASLLNRIFTKTELLAKILAQRVQKINSNFNDPTIINVDNKIKLKFNKHDNNYSYLDEESIEYYQGSKWGFACFYEDKSGKPVSKSILNQINTLANLKELLRAISLGDNDIDISGIVTKDLLLFYARDIKRNFDSFNSFAKKDGLPLLRKNNPNKPFWSKVYIGTSNILRITYVLPVYDSDKIKHGFVYLTLSYNKLTELLDKELSGQLYLKYPIIRIITDSNGNIVHLPYKYYDLLSIPKNSHSLRLKKGLAYNANLNSSTDPNIKKLLKIMRNKNYEYLQLKIKEKNYSVSFKNIPVNGWDIIVLAETDVLHHDIDETKREYKGIHRDMYKSFSIYFIIILFCGLIVSFFIFKKLFVKPIEILRSKVSSIGEGNFNIKIKNIGFIKEILGLAGTFNDLGIQLMNYTKRLKAEAREKQSIITELEVAAKLQESVLPRITDEFKREEFALYTKLIPAKEMSGDFFDFYYLNDETIAIVLADVSGKGLPAAFFMSMSRAYIKETCLSPVIITPAEVLNKINITLSKDNDECMFLTMYLVFYNFKTGKLIYSNAGHHEFITVDDNGVTETAGISQNTAIGIYEDSTYTNSELQLAENQIFAVYTDGITEAPDNDNNEFGTEKLVKIFENNFKKNLYELGGCIIDEVLDFQDGKKFDDITLVMLKRK
ncbi:MAG: PP2C family protein-serine/threonine phosphatase [bacterium]|nr:PP2C family protein-serine/threonine phosphatase [bacterium]